VSRQAEGMHSVHEALPIEAQLANFTVMPAIATAPAFRLQMRTKTFLTALIRERGKWCSNHDAALAAPTTCSHLRRSYSQHGSQIHRTIIGRCFDHEVLDRVDSQPLWVRRATT